jgi:hypothetical protein
VEGLPVTRTLEHKKMEHIYAHVKKLFMTSAATSIDLSAAMIGLGESLATGRKKTKGQFQTMFLWRLH